MIVPYLYKCFRFQRIQRIQRIQSTTQKFVKNKNKNKMSCIIPKRNHIMDLHMKTWTGYGKTRLSTVTFSTDPVPTIIRTDSMDFEDKLATNYVIVPPVCIKTMDDVWTFVAIE